MADPISTWAGPGAGAPGRLRIAPCIHERELVQLSEERATGCSSSHLPCGVRPENIQKRKARPMRSFLIHDPRIREPRLATATGINGRYGRALQYIVFPLITATI
jgi:hypothetical protein